MELFDDVRLRRAVNGAPLLNLATCQMLPPDFPSYHPHCPYTVPGPAYYNGPDRAQARRLITESGTRGMPVTVYGVDTGPTDHATNEHFAAVLRELGYQVTLPDVPLTPATYSYPVDSRNHVQITAYPGWRADYGSAANFYDTLLACATYKPASTDTFNVSEFCNKALDRQAVDTADTARTDPGKARRQWTQIDREITSQAPWIPTVNPADLTFVSRTIGNYQGNPFGPLYDQI